jgi:hypothetical protein
MAALIEAPLQGVQIMRGFGRQEVIAFYSGINDF